ncbi:MAG TPA: hypothetical protein VKT78_12425, partial [Fimbriimonadaceae bacterium]|nr:hypothetical protein [Fimbriimonadaceae bacterium]
LADPTQPIQLGYPVFTLPAQPPAVVQETGDTAIALWPNGPGIRFGSWAWWVSGAWQNPPAVRPFGQTSTILDWLAFKRVVAVPEAADAGIDAEIATLYDPVELSTRGDLAADTHSFLAAPNAKLAGFLVSALAELPPLAVFPGRARNADLQPTGAFALESWSHAKGPRDLVGAQVPANLFDPGGAQWTAPTGAPAGWCIARHDRAVTNSEDATFTVRSGDTIYAHASPWHGYSCVLLPGEGAQPWILQSDFGELHLAYLIAGDIYYKWSPFPVPLWQVETRITTDGGWSNPRMCLDHRGRIELRAVRSATVHRFVSDDDGRTWQA